MLDEAEMKSTEKSVFCPLINKKRGKLILMKIKTPLKTVFKSNAIMMRF
jgi:hypothetical protein